MKARKNLPAAGELTIHRRTYRPTRLRVLEVALQEGEILDLLSHMADPFY